MWDSLGTLVVQGGFPTLTAVAILAVIRGWLIPRWTHLERIKDLKESRDDWKAAYLSEQKVSAEKDKQISILLGRPKED